MSDFNSFVIFAEMRTGSNLLEATLNSIKRVTCFGEAFNPYMLGWPDTDQIRGMTLKQREKDPLALFEAITSRDDHLSGFRYFHDHDPRVFDAIIANRRCAKIILTRNPIDSYVSTELARQTNQWKLNQTETPIPASITYHGEDFRRDLSDVLEFQQRVLHALQSSGQTAFWLNYDDLRDEAVLTGLMHFLGRRDLKNLRPASDQVPQNPRAMSDKVENFEEMRADLALLDPFQLSRTPTFEPRRGPAVPSFVACTAGSGLLHMPLRGGPSKAVNQWLRRLGPVERDFTQNGLKDWLRGNPGRITFTVLRHPLHRAWSAFEHLLTSDQRDLRAQLRSIHRVALPDEDALAEADPADHVDVFADFLAFLRRNLNAQTSLPVLPIWATQLETVAGFSRFLTPDLILRENRLPEELADLAARAGLDDPGFTPVAMPDLLQDKALQKAARAAYQRDYIHLGFSNRP